ncbi:MAG: hypothetical protein FWC22_02620 [Treponema sp.]|nr:hypothetical protein [Treponema sp.]
MSDNSNPYQSPEAPIVPETPKSGILTGTMLSFLKEASPWLRFIGILGYIYFGIICLFTLIAFIAVITGNTSSFNFGFDFLEAIGGAVVLIVYGLMGLIIFFPAHFTYKFGAYIRNYFNSNSSDDLELAFKNNKSLWLFSGIIAIISISIVALILIIGLIAIIAAL